MKYIYYAIWIGLASLHGKISKMLFVVNKILFKVRKTSEIDQKKWKDDYNKGFLGFPNGIIDWFAYGLILAFIFIPVIILSVAFDNPILFSSKIVFFSVFISVSLLVYYWIYYKNIDWLKEKINKVSKKYYL